MDLDDESDVAGPLDQDADLSALDDPEDAGRVPIERAVIAAIRALEPIKVDQVPHQEPPVPWFYAVLDGLGQLAMFLGVIVVGVGVVSIVIGVAAEDAEEGITFGVSAFGTGILMLLTAAVQLIGVDIAKNIRAIRYHR